MSNQLPFNPVNLGAQGKINQPGLFGHVDGGGERALYRKHLCKAFGNMHNSGLKSSPSLYNKNILGPFRTAFNAGDVVTNHIEQTNTKYGHEANHVGGNNLSRLKMLGDGMGRQGNAMYAGNPRFVYDGSDYARFKKLQAINRNYNDTSYGGANNNQAYTAVLRARH